MNNGKRVKPGRRNINLLRAFLKRGRPADTIYALNSAAAQNLAIALRESAESCGIPVLAYKKRGSSAVFLVRLDAEPWTEWREYWRDGRDGG